MLTCFDFLPYAKHCALYSLLHLIFTVSQWGWVCYVSYLITEEAGLETDFHTASKWYSKNSNESIQFQFSYYICVLDLSNNVFIITHTHTANILDPAAKKPETPTIEFLISCFNTDQVHKNGLRRKKFSNASSEKTGNKEGRVKMEGYKL